MFLAEWGAEPPRGGGRAGVLENRIQASLTAHWHDKGADWRADWKNKKTEIRGGPGPTLRRQSHAPGSWDKARTRSMCSTVQRRGGGSRGGDVPSRHGSLELTPGERETSDGTPPMTLDRHDEPTAMQRQRKRRGGPAAELRWAAAETSADGGARGTRRHRSQGCGLVLHHEWA